jgi:hypothetical protein
MASRGPHGNIVTPRKLSLAIALGFVAAAASAGALASGGNVSVGIGIGIPVGGPGYYPAPYGYAPYYPPGVVVPVSPPVYIERPAAQDEPDDWYYYCPEANGYYPYVKDCPDGWQRVATQPAD